MPLFGSKNNDATLHNTGNHSRNDYPPPATGPAGYTGAGAGTAGQGVYGSSTAGRGQYGGQGLVNENPAHTGHNQAVGGPGAGTNIPPAGAVHHGTTPHSGGGAGERLIGKVESTLGSLVGSNSLKEKGLQKQGATSGSVKLQGSELAEAERLEREALVRRERAVAHGAHPANSSLGAGHVGATGPGGAGTQART